MILFVFHRRIQKRDVTFRYPKGYKFVILLVFSMVALVIFLGADLEFFFTGRTALSGKAAVLEKTQAYRVPDSKGAVNALFGEGQPVIVGDYLGAWLYARSPDGRSGWVLREMVITY
jgi:hypothetical protein